MSDLPGSTDARSGGRGDLLLRYLRPADAPTPESLKDRLIAAAVCAALVTIALGAGLALEHYLHVPNVLLVFLPVVLFAAVRYGFWTSVLTAVLSLAATSYFTDPVFSFAVADANRLWAFVIFVVVAAFTSTLATQIRQQVAAVSRYSRTIEQLYAFSSKLASLSSTHELVSAAALQIGSMLSANVALLVPEHGALRVKATNTAGAALDARELLAANWCWQHGRPAGRGTDVFAGLAQLYLPLETDRGTVGVLCIRREPSTALTPDQSKLLDALRDQLAVCIDRARLAEEILETEMLAESEKLRTALLTSISHDLRTPLASILGNISSLREYGHLYDQATCDEMLALAEDETQRLCRFVENLLQMIRIDAGALQPTLENVDLSDLIGAALKRAEKSTANHVVGTDLPADLPMVPLDFVLAEHVLVNLLDNAAKYAPAGSRILVAVAEQADSLRLTVTDEGPGISDQDLPRIFERFFRAEMTDRRPAGVGLGLAICKGFVEAMGGTITAYNRLNGNGAVFEVTFSKTRAEEQFE